MIQRLAGYSSQIHYINPLKSSKENDKNKGLMFSFKGMSSASCYKTTFDFLSAKILKSSPRKYGIDGSFLSSKNISKAIEQIFSNNKVFLPFAESNIFKINWRNYIPNDVREYCVKKINSARAVRLQQWRNFLENPTITEDQKEYQSLINNLKKNKSLVFVIWNAINSEISVKNRHIPAPFDIKALHETVKHFEQLAPIHRQVACSAISFLEMYTHRLRDNLLMRKGLTNEQEIWVKIPSAKRDKENLEKNIAKLEILSHKNWCTRSSVDKAADALADGDFYIYLTRDEKSIWQPRIGMASCRGKIDQIQGAENNNFIPIQELDNIKKFFENNPQIKCQSGVFDDGPKALQQILIAEKLNEQTAMMGKTLLKAIRENDDLEMLHIAGYETEILHSGNYIIDTYKPQFMLREKGGIVVPYTFMGIDEDEILANVEKIDGDFILFNKNKIFCSTITKFPPNLKKVTGYVICTEEQYNKFKEDIHRVVTSQSMIKIFK